MTKIVCRSDPHCLKLNKFIKNPDDDMIQSYKEDCEYLMEKYNSIINDFW